MKIFKGCFMGLIAVVGIIVFLLVIFFTWNSYTSPVNEAGREYKKTMESYEGSEIQSMEDVYERIEVLETHYNSPVFSKMQGGEKVSVTRLDVETLFGTPDQVLEDVDVPFMDTVHQYHYDDFVLNLHQDRDSIEAFVTEKYSGILYEEQDLTALFFEIMAKHQPQRIADSETVVKLSLEEMWPLIGDNTPTREVYENGWSTGYQNHIFYFDDGKGKNAPQEYLNLQLQSEKNATELQFMERRFNEPFLSLDSKEEAEAKQTAYSRYQEIVHAKTRGETEKQIVFEELAQDFGEIAKLTYRFRNGEIWVSWLSLQEDGNSMEIRAEVRLTKEMAPSTISEVMDLEIFTIRNIKVYNVDEFRLTADFIGQ